jgi:hypothetical protein
MSINVDTRKWVVGKDYPEWMEEIGISTISKGYLLPDENVFDSFKRVSKAAAKRLKRKDLQPIFYEVMVKNWLCLASPVLSNMGTERGLPISCVTGDTWVNTIDGGKIAKNIQEGDLVLTHKNRFRKVIGILPTKDRGDIYELKVGTRTTPLRITGNHQVLTNTGWKRVDELNPKIDLIAVNGTIDFEQPIQQNIILDLTKHVDFEYEVVEGIIYPKSKSNSSFNPISSTITITPEFMHAVGLWFADGHIYKQKQEHSKGIGLTSNSKDEVELSTEWASVIFKHFGVPYSTYYGKTKNTIIKFFVALP